MPRSSATARKSQSSRHENGLVGSGKKVTKQKSNGHLNGSSNGGGGVAATTGSTSSSTCLPSVDFSSSRSSSDPSVTATIATATTTAAKLNGSAADSSSSASPSSAKFDNNVRGTVNGNPTTGKANSDMFALPNGAVAQNGGLVGQASRRIEQAASAAASGPKRSASNASINPLQLASTILKSCPMYDTIAILIFLLQLPPMVLTLVQFLFASLTFMPPTGAASGSFTSNFDIFQGPAGTPSLGTMLAADVSCLLIWGVCMWTWAQNFAIDLAHVQVAITLGGGGSGKNGGVNSICVGIVLILHLVRSKGIQDVVIGYLLSSKILSPDMLAQYSYLIPVEFRRSEPPSSPSWIRSLLAVHILAQAGTAMARRSMAQNRSPAPPRPGGKRSDTEASAGSQGGGGGVGGATQLDSSFDSGTSLSSLLGPDNQILPSAALKDGRDRLISAKKRRRQANQVRSRQPFWAALASTKVTVMREYEHSRVMSRTTRGAAAMTEEDLQGVSLDDGLVWITDVDSSSIRYAAGDFASADDPTLSGACEAGRLRNEEMEPFYVCVNGALWATATVCKVDEATPGSNTVHWRGEISGLAPNCAYTCSFVRSDTDEEICVMSVKTPSTSDAEQVSSVSTPPQPSYRPSSPTTTLKNSIVNAEAKLNEKRARLKKTKNDHKLVISKVKKELDGFNNRLNSGTDENRQKQRSLQLERTIRQTEEATSALDAQLSNMTNIPEEEMQEWTAQKAEYERERDLLSAAKEEVAATRAAISREVASLESDLSSTVQRRERLQSRRARVNEQHERIVSANAQGLNERERRAAEQFAREQDQAKLETTFNEQLASIAQSLQDYQLRTNQLHQQCSAIDQAIQQQQQQQQILIDSGSLAAAGGNLPGSNAISENPGMSMGPLANTASNHRSLLGLSFPPVKSSPLQHTVSPVNGSSHPTSPAPQPSYLQHVPSSPLAQTSFFGKDSIIRDRSFSNRSGRSSFYSGAADIMDGSRLPPFQVDLSELVTDKRGSSGSENNGPLNPISRPTSSPFKRAGSNESGSGSGSPGSAPSRN